MTRGELLALAQAIDDFDSTEAGIEMRASGVPPRCLACGQEFTVTEYGNDPTPLDDQCAHEAVEHLARALLREVARRVGKELADGA